MLSRWLTSFTLLDHDTVCGTDKFENFFTLRVPPGCEEDANDDPTATKFKWEQGYLNGAAFKLDTVNQFFIGEVGTSLQKTKLSSLSRELVLYVTSMGSIACFLPFETKAELDFFTHLEMYLRIEAQPLCGRDHVAFRSAISPVKDVVDGDLCEQYQQLDFSQQKVLAEELESSPAEILKKLEEMRQKII